MSQMCKHYLRGKCRYGAECRHSHGGRNPVIARQQCINPRGAPIDGFCYSVPLPKHLPSGVVAGNGMCNLYPIEEGLKQRVRLVPCEGEIKVYLKTPDDQLLRDVKQKLEHLFASLFIGREASNRLLVSFDGSGTRRDITLRFIKYRGALLNHLTTNTSCKDRIYYFLHCADETPHYDSLIDEDDQGHGSAADGHPTPTSFILDCEDVTTKLHCGLKLIKGQNLRGKLEARFGRKVWYSLPKELVDEEVDLMKLEEMFESCVPHGTMNTCIDATKVEMLVRELERLCPQKHVIEVYNFRITLLVNGQRKSMEVRVVAMEDGTLKIIRVKKNEKKTATIDVLCLRRQHDFRLDLCLHETVHKSGPEYSSVEKFVETMYISRPGYFSFCPCTEQWKVNLLRYKRQSTFVLEDTFLITLSDVKECKVNWERYSSDNLGDQLEVNLEDFSDRHWELELNNILWECAFAKDAGQTPEEALSIYMEHPSVDVEVMAMVPYPWEPETLISQEDLRGVLQKVDWLSEQLEL